MTQTIDAKSAFLAKAEGFLNEGRISQVTATLDQITDPRAMPPRQYTQYVYLTLCAALYGFGDQDRARGMNAEIDGKIWAPMRYRLALRQKDYATAARIRRQPGLTDKERWDFRCTLGLHLIWRHRYAWGFHFYQDRWHAINFSKILPRALRYHPLADPADDPPRVVLEQGVGECLLALMHLRAAPPQQIIALPRYRRLVQQVIPSAQFIPADAIPQALRGEPAICAADLFGRAWRQQGSFAPPRTLAAPLRDYGAAPIHGICWRGGSGQNRREERHIPLHLFLDLLPREGRYIPLQFDITPEEKALLARDGRCQPPLVDVTGDPEHILQMVRRMAGVISVDSANWHFAGAADVPLLALMNRQAHWFWGPDADAAWTYPTATTLPKAEMSQARVRHWMQQAEAAFFQRPLPASARPARPARRPILIAGLPRSRTSMTMRILARHGVWVGDTMKATSANPVGFFENVSLKDQVIKKVLADLGADPNGVTSLPDIANMPILPVLANGIMQVIAKEGYDGTAPWAFKDPKLTLLWPVFASAFPDAHWIIPRRDRKSVIRSLTEVHFMRRHSSDPEYWAMFCAAYDQRLDLLAHSGARVSHIDTDALVNGDYAALAAVLTAAGVAPDPRIFRDAIDPDLSQDRRAAT